MNTTNSVALRSGVRPVDQMHSTYSAQNSNNVLIDDAHNLFRKRGAFTHFNPRTLDHLTDLLRTALNANPNDVQLLYELAYTLLQNRCDDAGLLEARRLNSQALIGLRSNKLRQQDTRIPENLKAKALRLRSIINRAQENVKLLRQQELRGRVNWAVYNRCPMVCSGCYNTFLPDQLTIEQALVGLDKLADAHVEELIISGGDPLLWPDLLRFVRYAYTKGMIIGIDTTGFTLTFDMLQQLGPYVAYIGLPLDGSTPAIQNSFRHGSKNILGKTLQNLAWCDELNIPIKINTTVNQHNIDDLIEIGLLISLHTCVNHWSVFQWSSLRATESLRQKMAVPREDFERNVSKLQTYFSDIHVRTRTVEAREFTHFFIQNNGQVVTFGSEPQEEFLLGSILTDDISNMINLPIFNRRSSKYISTERFAQAVSRVNKTVHNRPSSLPAELPSDYSARSSATGTNLSQYF
jgi:MoaA/NifB/PqqE/SkfB family radical SAM enzyme